MPKLGPFEIDHKSGSLDALGIRAESRVFRAAGLTSDPWAAGWRVTGPPGVHAAGSNRLRGELRAVTFAPGSPSLDWTLFEKKSERSEMPAGYRGWPERRYGRFGLRQLTAGLGANLWGCSSKLSLSRVFLGRVLLHERQCRTHGGLSAVLPPSSVATRLRAVVVPPIYSFAHTELD